MLGNLTKWLLHSRDMQTDFPPVERWVAATHRGVRQPVTAVGGCLPHAQEQHETGIPVQKIFQDPHSHTGRANGMICPKNRIAR